MLIKHVRDWDHHPFATLVAIKGSPPKIGIAVCHPKYDTFNKKRGIEIAFGRALSDDFNIGEFFTKCPKRMIDYNMGKWCRSYESLKTLLYVKYEEMLARAEIYFK